MLEVAQGGEQGTISTIFKLFATSETRGLPFPSTENVSSRKAILKWTYLQYLPDRQTCLRVTSKSFVRWKVLCGWH
jgi:hypothetical protein